jgi:Bifunctional PLP-dependent enzyme with beta-cystathionase and maltose regulon repressor activities
MLGPWLPIGIQDLEHPGLKCAQLVGTGSTAQLLHDQVPLEATFGVGHFGVLGTLAAYRDGRDWLTEVLTVLDARRTYLESRLASFVDQGVSWVRPEASYLAWLRIDGLGEDPAEALLSEGRIAVNSGLPFGAPGVGHARINFATSETVLAEVLDAMGAVIAGHAS